MPQKGPFILASNHISYADPAVVGVACSALPVSFMAKKELFNNTLAGRWIKAMGCIPTDRASGSFEPLKKAVRQLKKGEVVALFPEGTRSLDGKLGKAEAGIGLIAIKSGVNIIPIYVSGTDKVLPRGQKHITPNKVRAKIGRPVNIEECKNISDKRKSYECVGEKVMEAIRRLRDD